MYPGKTLQEHMLLLNQWPGDVLYGIITYHHGYTKKEQWNLSCKKATMARAARGYSISTNALGDLWKKKAVTFSTP